MKSIAENANDFADLRTADNGNCVYVDKTDYFHRRVIFLFCRDAISRMAMKTQTTNKE